MCPSDYLEKEAQIQSLHHAKEQLLTLGNHLDGFIERFEFNDLLLQITSRATDVDTFIDKHEPWRLAKDPDKREELHAVLYTAAECLRILCLYIYPFMPKTAENIAEQLGIAVPFGSPLLKQEIKWGELQGGTKIRKGNSLFPRIESKPQGAKTVSESPSPPQPTPVAPTPVAAAAPAAAPTPAAPAQITIDEFMKIQLKTAKVLSAERVPKSEKLLKLQVSLVWNRTTSDRRRHRKEVRARSLDRENDRHRGQLETGEANGDRIARHGPRGRRQRSPRPRHALRRRRTGHESEMTLPPAARCRFSAACAYPSSLPRGPCY